MNNKKILSLVLAFTLMLSTTPTVFAGAAAKTGSDAKIISAIGVLSGDSAEGVTQEYLEKETTRIQAAIMYLRLQGKEEEALSYNGKANFTDAGTIAWAGGRAVMAYLKANPELGWIGSEDGSFGPSDKITSKQYYKVMLEALGYRQTTANETGDFEWKDVMSFADKKGLDNLSDSTVMTNNDLAIATVEALKAEVDGTETTLAVKLVDAGIIDKEAAVKVDLYSEGAPVPPVEEEIPASTDAKVDKAVALGNTVVEVTFDDEVDKGAADTGNYSIKGLTVNSAVVTGSDTVWLMTDKQKAGSLYELTVDGKTVNFTGIAAVSGGPTIKDVDSADVEEVVITFDKNVDYATATDTANYDIKGIDVTEAEVTEGNEVTLTTEGLKNDTSYSIKVTGIKSVDGASRKSSSDDFRTDFDEAAPRINSTNSKVETNQRIILYFNEKVTEESVEELDNYTLKVSGTDGAELDIISAVWDNDDENNVEITTEEMEKGESYKLSVSNIADQRKSANVMTKPDSWTFDGIRGDKDEPELTQVTVISKDKLVVKFTDKSRMDKDSVEDTGNYVFTKGSDELDVNDVTTLKNETGIFRALVEVDAMEAGKSYELEVSGVTDEFGNIIEKASKRVNPSVSDFASSALVNVAINDESLITLTFSKEMDEASAENIGNYSIDGSIGTPISATLDDEGLKVELKVNKLTNGEKYDLTVKGVKDLAGNALDFTKEDIVAASGNKWDEDAPELEDAQAENKYVAALQFSEEVKFAADTELWLTGGSYTSISPLRLKAKLRTDDNTVVEFSLYNGGKWVALDENTEYTVMKVSSAGAGITDLIGNSMVMPSDPVTFRGSDDEPDYAEVDDYDQTDESTFEVVMSRNVIFANSADAAAGVANVNGFKITIDDNKVTFSGVIKDEKEYVFDFSALLTDEHGMPAVNDEVDDNPPVNRTVLVGENTDDEEPYIKDIRATDNITVKVEFNEKIAVAEKSYFDIRNTDLDKDISISKLEIDEKTLILTLSDPLEGRYEYELTMEENKVADFAGNKADEDSVDFDGTDLAPVK